MKCNLSKIRGSSNLISMLSGNDLPVFLLRTMKASHYDMVIIMQAWSMSLIYKLSFMILCYI